MHPTTQRPFVCVSCEAQIRGRVEFHVGLPFCCAGCAVGGPCSCSYDPDPLDAGPVGAEDDAVTVRVRVPALV